MSSDGALVEFVFSVSTWLVKVYICTNETTSAKERMKVKLEIILSILILKCNYFIMREIY